MGNVEQIFNSVVIVRQQALKVTNNSKGVKMNKQPSPDHSKNLQDTNLAGYRHLILPGRSPILALESFLVKLRKFVRTQHLDINIPRALIIIILLGSIILMTKRQKDDYELVKDLGALTGVGTGIIFAMSNLHNQYHDKKRSRASEYIQEWRSENMIPFRRSTKNIFVQVFFDQYPTRFNSNLFNKCGSVLLELKKTPDGVENLEEAQSKILVRLLSKNHDTERHEIQVVLSFFEHMGQDVKCNVADSDYLKDYFFSIVINHYEFLRKYIEYEQYDRSRRLKYCNFVYLAQTWEKEGFVPELPRICNRPLVITAKDIQKANEAKNRHGMIHRR